MIRYDKNRIKYEPSGIDGRDDKFSEGFIFGDDFITDGLRPLTPLAALFVLVDVVVERSVGRQMALPAPAGRRVRIRFILARQ